MNLTQYVMSSKFVLGIICQNMDSSTPHYFNVHCQCVGMLHSSCGKCMNLRSLELRFVYVE